MQTEYATVVDPASLMTSGVPMLIHAFVVVLQTAAALHFLVHGAFALRGGAPGPSMRRLGSQVPADLVSGRRFGAFQVAIGVAIMLPLVLGAPTAVSALALAAGIVYVGRRMTDASASGQPALRGVGAGSFVVLLFLFFEGEDPARQTYDVVRKAIAWRNHELGWQMAHDVDSPKVGDLAPDFELQDPSGEHSIRLSTFRGKRPVALVFGSYT